MKLVRHLAQRTDHFRMARMTDKNKFISLGIIPVDLVVNFDD